MVGGAGHVASGARSSGLPQGTYVLSLCVPSLSAQAFGLGFLPLRSSRPPECAPETAG